MVDESFHVFFHGGAWRWHDLVIFDFDGTRGHLVETLMDDTEGLAEFFHAAEVPVVAVSVDADRDVELDLIVGVVRLALAHIPWHTGATEHDASPGVVEGIGGGDDTNTLSSTFPDPVVCQ